jgi:uncharacterized protein DUF5753
MLNIHNIAVIRVETAGMPNEAIAARPERQASLDGGNAPMAWFVVDEAVIRRPVRRSRGTGRAQDAGERHCDGRVRCRRLRCPVELNGRPSPLQAAALSG